MTDKASLSRLFLSMFKVPPDTQLLWQSSKGNWQGLQFVV